MRNWYPRDAWKQGGRFGNKDASGKECGCNLYPFPAAIVHLNHFHPLTQGDGNSAASIQANCTACNFKAGNYVDPDD